MFYLEGHYPTICPCCKAQFFFPSGEKINDPHQKDLFPAVAEPVPHRVHNHGPDDGAGIECREYLLNGKVIGECLIREAHSEIHEEDDQC